MTTEVELEFRKEVVERVKAATFVKQFTMSLEVHNELVRENFFPNKLEEAQNFNFSLLQDLPTILEKEKVGGILFVCPFVVRQ